MNKLLFIFSVFSTFALCQTNAQENGADQWGAISNNLQMSIRLKNGASGITNGQPCILEVRYRNISTNETQWVLRMNWTESDATYSFAVVDPSGKDVSPDLDKPFGGSASPITIGPGQTQGLDYNFGGICKIDKIGTYRIVAKKKILSGGKNGPFQICSNLLLVKVVPNTN